MTGQRAIGAVALGLVSLTGFHPTAPLSIALPAGFRLDVFASGLDGPRFMTRDPAGTLLVTLPGRGQIVALPDQDGDGRADGAVEVARGLDRPYGIAFRRGALYVAETGRIRRFRYDAFTRSVHDPVTLVADLPAGAHHWTRTLVVGPDDRLYVSVGSSCDVCREQDRRRSAIVRYDVDGGGERLFATGLRSVVGLAFAPQTGALWGTVNERDWKSGGAPPDYVTEIREGGAYGWPDCFAAGGRFAPDPEFAGSGRCADMTLPTLELPAHSAPLGLTFYTATQFPPAYRADLFVAYHGSRPGLKPATGYKIVRVRFRDGRVVGLEDFATGWLRDGRIDGRPADLVVGADGALYVSDDHAGRIYRIVHRP